jgi:hypothetical protein
MIIARQGVIILRLQPVAKTRIPLPSRQLPPIRRGL